MLNNNKFIFDYSEEEVKRLKRIFSDKIDKIVEVNRKAIKGIPAWKVLFFIMDKMAKGNYYGTIKLKIEGNVTQDPREDDVTHRLDFKYNLED